MPRIENEDFYNASIKRYGITPKGAHWQTQQSQQVRFEVLSHFISRFNKPNIVDAGSGFGDMYHYLQKMKIDIGDYIGIDSHKQMVSIASAQTSKKVLRRNILYDILPVSDIYISSGALNILTKFETYLFIERILEHSVDGAAFNVLTGVNKEKIYNRVKIEPLAVRLCQKGYFVEVIDGYLEGDATLFVSKKRFL